MHPMKLLHGPHGLLDTFSFTFTCWTPSQKCETGLTLKEKCLPFNKMLTLWELGVLVPGLFITFLNAVKGNICCPIGDMLPIFLEICIRGD